MASMYQKLYPVSMSRVASFPIEAWWSGPRKGKNKTKTGWSLCSTSHPERRHMRQICKALRRLHPRLEEMEQGQTWAWTESKNMLVSYYMCASDGSALTHHRPSKVLRVVHL